MNAFTHQFDHQMTFHLKVSELSIIDTCAFVDYIQQFKHAQLARSMSSSVMFALLLLSVQVAMTRTTATADPKIVQLLAQADNADKSGSPGIVSIIETVLTMLIAAGLAVYMHMPPKSVGVHPDNRYGFGVSAAAMHDLASKIVRMGWSWLACSGAVCMEDDASGRIASYTVKLQQGSHLFGQSKLHEIKAGSLSNGHTNQFLVAALDSVPSEHENLTIDGRMSVAKMSAPDPCLAEAFKTGLKWLVIKAEAGVLYPNLARLVQAARQATGQVQNEETTFQVMENIQNSASAMSVNGCAPDWDVVRRRAAQSEPKCADDIPYLCNFVQKYGGGISGGYIKEINEFVKYCVPNDRKVAGSFFESLSKLKLEGHELCPLFVMAVIKAQAKCPQDKVHSHVCRYITNSEVNALQGPKKESMIEAEALLKAIRAVALKLDLPRQEQTKLLGKADCLIAKIVLDKSVPEKYETIKHVAAAFFEEAMEHNEGNMPENPWKEVKHVETQVEKKEEGGLLEYKDDVPQCVNKISLMNQGFVPNARVKLRSETSSSEGRRY